MQKKWTMLAVALVAISGILVLYSTSVNTDAADASGDSSVTYSASLNYNTERVLHLILNENYFQNIDPNHVMEWYYFNSSVYVKLVFQTDESRTYSNTVLVQSGENSLYEFYLEYKNIGEYDLKVKSLTNEVQTTTQLKLRCDVMITIQDGGHAVRQYATDPMFINVNLSLNNANDLPTDLSYKIDNTVCDIRHLIFITEGTPTSMIPVVSASYSADHYYWYAVDLPLGMAMTSTGIISGVPIQPSSGDITPATVYVEDGFGNGKTFSVPIWVSEQTISLSYYLLNGIIDSSTNLADCVHEPTQFFSQRGKTVNMAIFKANPSSFNMTVSVVKIDSSTVKRTTLDSSDVTIGSSNYAVYSLPTEGTGVYRVDIRDQSGVLQDRFDFFVMPKLLAVESAIIVGSDSTS